MSLPTPNTRKEQYLNAIATGNAGDLPTPITREEEYLYAIAKSGGGGGGTTNYNALDNKPQIAGTTLQGDKSLADLGIASASDVATALAGKVDKVAGKGLSTNDYSDTEKGKVADNKAAIETMENVLGAKNQFALAYNLGTTGLSTVDDELKNTLTDTVSSFVLHFRGIKNDDTQDFLFRDVISSTGNYEYTVTITSNYKSLLFKHNGTTQDLGIYIPAVATGRWILSFNVVSYNPSVVGGLEITEIMLRPAGTDATYVPYAMTNAELTERVITTVETGTTTTGGIITIPKKDGFYLASATLEAPTGGYMSSYSRYASNLYMIFVIDYDTQTGTISFVPNVAVEVHCTWIKE